MPVGLKLCSKSAPSGRYSSITNFLTQNEIYLVLVRAGSNTIQRRSIESTLTIPFQFTFRNEDAIPLTSGEAAQNFIFCGCGWPDHLLIPKGTPDGLLCDLFVILTDYNQTDRVRTFPKMV